MSFLILQGTSNPGPLPTALAPETDNRPFGTEREFVALLIAVAIYVLAVQLFLFSSRVQTWAFKQDKKAQDAYSGIGAVVLSTTTILVLCYFRCQYVVPSDNLLAMIAEVPRNFVVGLLVASLVPMGLAASKVIAIYSALRRIPEKDRNPRSVALALGTAVLGLINLAGSVASLISLYRQV